MSPSHSDASRRKLLILGAGPMGLATAYFASLAGFNVEVLEADDRPGGMAAHFDFDGLSLERFYHFCCRSDVDTIELLASLDLPEINWVPTRMGYYIDGRLYRFGDPISLMTLPKLGLIEKVRYALMAFTATKRRDWPRLDRLSAKQWLTDWCGARAYQKLWRPLLHLKFFEFDEQISAAWVWQRIARLGKSRQSLFKEELGYITGGSEALVAALVAAIERQGGKVRLRAPVEQIVVEQGRVRGVILAGGERLEADAVVSTIPVPLVPNLLQADAPELAADYATFNNVGVACVVHKLKRSVSPNFWVNISDDDIEIPGMVEFSNLRPMPDVIVYVPYYMPTSHPKFSWSDDALIEQSFSYLQKLNPDLQPTDRIASHVGRLRYAQPVCEVGFAARIPDPLTSIAGLQIADTSFYYPEDRGVSESIKFAKRLAANLGHS